MIETFKSRVKDLKEGMQVEVNARGLKVIIDEPQELGGTNKGMNPLEITLGALGACQAIVAKMLAPMYDFSYEEFYMELEGDINSEGLNPENDIRSGFQEIRMTMHFKTNEPLEKVKDFAKVVESTCPVSDSLHKGVKIVLKDIKKD